MASTTSGDVLPSGSRIFMSVPDIFFIPELVFGGLVWILVASTRVDPVNPLGWVMFVSVFCFVVTTLWFFIFLCGGNQSSIWPSLVFGGLVWILVASTHVFPSALLGWVMFVSIFCFIMTFLWIILFGAGCHRSGSIWAAADFAYHGLAALFYLSAGVDLAIVTLSNKAILGPEKIYRIDISAVVFCFAATLLYFIHTILSAIRWKHF
ncbi:myelin and lymphocyte protein-like isoform 2-T2 [Pholidichthys leucotaenia]